MVNFLESSQLRPKVELYCEGDDMAINYRKCPECNSRNVIKILYGEPTGEALFMEAQGKIKLGGCLITDK